MCLLAKVTTTSGNPKFVSIPCNEKKELFNQQEAEEVHQNIELILGCDFFSLL